MAVPPAVTAARAREAARTSAVPCSAATAWSATSSGARSRSRAPTMSAGASRSAAGSHPGRTDRSGRAGLGRAERSPGQPGLRWPGLRSAWTPAEARRSEPGHRQPADDGVRLARTPPVQAGSAGGGSDARISSSELASSGLPIRVRQASLAPQLRDSRPPPAPGSHGLRHRSVRRARRAAGRRLWQRTARTISHWRRPGVARGGAEHHERTAARMATRPFRGGRGRRAAGRCVPARRSPSGQPFGSCRRRPGSTDPDPADSADDERGGE